MLEKNNSGSYMTDLFKQRSLTHQIFEKKRARPRLKRVPGQDLRAHM